MITVATTSVPTTVDTPQQPFPIPAVATTGVLVVVEVVILVMIIAVVYILRKKKAIVMKGIDLYTCSAYIVMYFNFGNLQRIENPHQRLSQKQCECYC